MKTDVEVQQMEQILSNNMSGSQLDLVVHGDQDPFTPSQTKLQYFESTFTPDDVDCELEMVTFQPDSNLYEKL